MLEQTADNVVKTPAYEFDKETLEAVSVAKSNGITISLVGIKLDKNGKQLAEKRFHGLETGAVKGVSWSEIKNEN